jgi:hypothetical protein
MSIPDENRCGWGDCGKILTWGEYNFSMNKFKQCKKTGNGLCIQHQKEQRLVEYPEKLAKFINTHI